MIACQWQIVKVWIGLGLTGVSAIALSCVPEIGLTLEVVRTNRIHNHQIDKRRSEHYFTQSLNDNFKTTETQSSSISTLARSVTVRILTPSASGSGVIVQRQGQTYIVLTNWHVVGFSDRHTVIAPDNRQYVPASAPKRLGSTDLALIQFRSPKIYQVARISTEAATVGEPVFAAGFPMYRQGTSTTTFDQGLQVFRFTNGEVSLLPPKSLSQGYRLGYTNDIEVGMSGGPIFNANGFLIGINGRLKNRDPDFGVYTFEDGTEPSPILLEQMVNSSWGIPISTYLQFVSLNQRS